MNDTEYKRTAALSANAEPLGARIVISESLDPYRNLSIEQTLTAQCPHDVITLFLWRNEKTVVIGKNQSMCAQCRIGKLLSDGGHPARRLSGGGAVFHDRGNLNFSFIATDKHYSVARQSSTVLNGLLSLGIFASVNGRNDICCDDRKISGNAYYEITHNKCHHGTVMLSVDIASLERYLNTDPEKYRSKGVESMRARVMNLADKYPQADVGRLTEALISAFRAEYGSAPITDVRMLDTETVEKGREFFASDKWLYGRSIGADFTAGGRFKWGGIKLHIKTEAGIVTEALIYTDALEADCFAQTETALVGRQFSPDGIYPVLSDAPHGADLIASVKKELF